ncbi:hypothetical protein KFE25_012274 [Diacronema lutheri]|uniref:beta-ketoacyl-[acyl-carrier-protein] synthase I n=1 Tax=Diacronema lutheri TaxID=2081491 RepID=A0A8J5XGS2_DIALT|nr:hypothetical protein KFE25_012274 [Diacronema lutheri]
MAVANGRRRVVVTGLGLVTPLGVGVDAVWRALLGRATGVSRLGAPFDGLPCAVGACVPRGTGGAAAGTFDEREWVEPSHARAVAPFAAFALAAAHQALADAHFATGAALPRAASERCGVAFGSGIGSMQDIVDAASAMAARGHRRVSPFFVPRALVNMAAGQIALRHALRGPCHSAATACATGAHSVGDAFRMIAHGDADLVVAGASEAAITPLAIAGFCRLSALSTAFNHEPERASRPFDRSRDGFVMGEGSGALVLESLEHALARGVGAVRADALGGGGGGAVAGGGAGRVYAELVGYGMSCDAHHITSPPPDGDGALRCMRAALADAHMSPSTVDYVSAHATSTPVGDEIELRALAALFGDGGDSGGTGAQPGARTPAAVSSTKGATGHLLGAAGAIEAVFAVLAAHGRVAPPGVNLDDADVPAGVREGLFELIVEPRALGGGPGGTAPVVTVSNSFGFGGTNASLVFRSLCE